MTISEAIVQMRYCKENGAVAVCLRAHEGNRHLIDPYFYPLYEEAQRLDMAIVVHVSNADAWLSERLKSSYDMGSSFSNLRVPTVTSCHEYIMSEVPTLFPDLRWGFVEVSAQWVPWLVKEARRRARKLSRDVPYDIFPEYRIYAACETDDDIPFILKYAGPDNIVIGDGLRPHGHLQRDGRDRHLPRHRLRHHRGREDQDPLGQPAQALRAVGVTPRQRRSRTCG